MRPRSRCARAHRARLHSLHAAAHLPPTRTDPPIRPLTLRPPAARCGLARFGQALLELPQCVGIIGGKPRSAHYFIGVTAASRLLYLDPHTVQPALRAATCATATLAPSSLSTRARVLTRAALELAPVGQA